MSDPTLPDRDHPVHTSSIERFNQATIIFLTVCAQGRNPLFARPLAVDCLIAAWKKTSNGWLVGRFVCMPDHVHLFCSPTTLHEEISLERWVSYWKSLSSRSWPWPDEQPIWQRHFWDTQLRPGEHYSQRWHYVRCNPVRAGLVEHPEQWQHQGELNQLF